MFSLYKWRHLFSVVKDLNPGDPGSSGFESQGTRRIGHELQAARPCCPGPRALCHLWWSLLLKPRKAALARLSSDTLGDASEEGEAQNVTATPRNFPPWFPPSPHPRVSPKLQFPLNARKRSERPGSALSGRLCVCSSHLVRVPTPPAGISATSLSHPVWYLCPFRPDPPHHASTAFLRPPDEGRRDSGRRHGCVAPAQERDCAAELGVC